MRFLSPFLSILLAPLLVCGPVLGQSTLGQSIPDKSAGAAGTAASPGELHIAQIQNAQPGTSLAVRVTDEAGAPVAGANVVFRFAPGTAAGTFADGAITANAQTGPEGTARVDGVHAAGAASILATASKGTAHAGTLIDQSFGPAPGTAAVAIRKPQPVAVPGPRISVVSQAAALPRTPGTVAEAASDQAAPLPTADYDSPDANVPIRHQFGPDSAPAGVSVVNGKNYGESGGHGGKLKWILLIAGAAGGGAAFALLHKGAGASSSSSSGTSIGTPSISVGHP